MTIDPETLAAYADGELDPLAAKRVERAMADDPSLAAEVERHRALAARLRGGFASLDAQPMPAGVEALFARTDNVVAFPTRKPAPRPQRWWGAIAASLVAGLLLGQLVPRSGGELGFEGGTAVAQGKLARALDTQLASGARPNRGGMGRASVPGHVPARCPGWLLETACKRRPRGMVAYPAERRVDRTRLTDPLTFTRDNGLRGGSGGLFRTQWHDKRDRTTGAFPAGAAIAKAARRRR